MMLYLVIAYLFGTVPFGFFAGKITGIDIRQYGSKNIGATNVFRVIGRKWGISVFILDAFKGFLAVQLPEIVMGHEPSLPFKLALAVAAVLGHTFPVWLKFKGGKGVATSLGVFIAAAPVPTSIAFGIWMLVFAISHIISVSSLAAALAFPMICFLTSRSEEGFPYLAGISLLLAAFIFYTHRGNIDRLRKGEEKRLF